MSRDEICEAKARLPLPDLMTRIGLADRAKKSARCPFHEDKHNSFSAWRNADGHWSWKCHAGCGGGDEITFLEVHEKLSRGDAIKRFLELAGNGDATPSRARPAQSGKAKPKPFAWQKWVAGLTDKHAQQIANWRGYSVAFKGIARRRTNRHSQRPCRISGSERGEDVGVHYRLKDGSTWCYEPNGIKAAPIIFGELAAGEPVHFFESTWDGLAFMDVTGERSGIVITRGAGNGRFAAVIPERCTVYTWKQNDELKDGKRAGDDWLKTSREHVNKSCTIKLPKIPVHDLNDWTRDGATANDLIAAMGHAEKIREAEETWLDALNKSVVTSSQLETLRLKPRKKLLDDWMCEGDLGFVFAFRGVGKTWFGLAIAQALSTGGALGDWKAHEAVNVLYVDGEMPPDLMNDRASGLNKGNDHLFFLNHLILFDRSGRVLNITNRDVQESLTGYCLAHSIKVLILDNLSTLASGMKENEADAWEIVNTWLLDLRRRGVAVIIIHHAGRSGQMRGTSKREDNVFWIIALDDMKKNADDKRGARFISYFTKPSRNTQDEVASYQWHFVTESNGQVTISRKLAQSLDVFLRVIDSGITKHDEIADAMKLAGYEVSRMAKKAEDQGLLSRPKRGEYCLTQKAKEMFANE